jgi:hypothetical protein
LIFVTIYEITFPPGIDLGHYSWLPEAVLAQEAGNTASMTKDQSKIAVFIQNTHSMSFICK